MDDCIDCIEAVARLHLYIDRELTVEEVEIVQQHLVDCPNCQCRFHFNMSLKRLIHERCTIEHAPERLRTAVLHLAFSARGGSVAVGVDSVLEMEIRADLECP